MFSVYVITNSVNGKSYVGITTRSVAQRWKEHLRAAERGETFTLYAAMRKWGASQFLVREIDHGSSWDELIKLEIQLIQKLNTKIPHGYNMTDGGDGLVGLTRSEAHKAAISRASKNRPPISETSRDKMRASALALRKVQVISDDIKECMITVAKARMTDEVKKKISQTTKGRIRSPYERLKGAQSNLGRVVSKETREKLSATMMGRRASEETRAKMSAARKGLRHSDEAKAKMSATRMGYRPSDETRARMSEARKRVCSSPEVRAKMSACRMGHPTSEAARAKMAEAARRRWQTKRDAAADRHNEQPNGPR